MKNKLTNYEIEQNEIFFQNVLNRLSNGGIYVYPACLQTYKKENDVFICSKEGYDAVKSIVSKKFLESRFKVA